MSVQVLAFVMELYVPKPGPKLVLMSLANHASKDTWECWPSQETIAKETSLGVRSIRRHVQWLEENGYIKRYQDRKPDGTYEVDQYEIIQRQVWPPDKLTDGQNVPQPADKMAAKPVSLTCQQKGREKPTKKRTSLPDDFPNTEAESKAEAYWQKNSRTDLCLVTERELFRAHHERKAELCASWDAAWRTWYVNAIKFNKPPRDPPKTEENRLLRLIEEKVGGRTAGN